MSKNNERLSHAEFFLLVTKYFDYLIDSYGFSVTDEQTDSQIDACELKMETQNWYVRIGHEYGYVYVHLGPYPTPRAQFGIGDIITFLEKGNKQSEILWFGPKRSDSLDYTSRIHNDLKWYADTLRLYCERISELFRENIFREVRAELDQWRKLREHRRIESFNERKYPI